MIQLIQFQFYLLLGLDARELLLLRASLNRVIKALQSLLLLLLPQDVFALLILPLDLKVEFILVEGALELALLDAIGLQVRRNDVLHQLSC